METRPEVYEGSCLCGRIRYRARAPLGEMDNCHCTDCRKSHGAAYATYVDASRSRFEVDGGTENLTTFAAASGTKRSFCSTCGATLFCWVDAEPEIIEIAVATLDTPIADRPRSHTFVRSKVSWLEILDGMPQYPAARPTGG